MHGVHRFKNFEYLLRIFKNSTYGIRFNSFQDAKLFKYAFLKYFSWKNLIGVKFIVSTLQARKDNDEICSIL